MVVDPATGGLATAPAVATAGATPNSWLTPERQEALNVLRQRLLTLSAEERDAQQMLATRARGRYKIQLSSFKELRAARVKPGPGTQDFYQVVHDSFAEGLRARFGGKSPSVQSIRKEMHSALVKDFKAYDVDPEHYKTAETHPLTDVLRGFEVNVDELDVREEYLQHTAATAGVWDPDDAEHMIDVVANWFGLAATLLLPDRARHVGDPTTKPMVYLYTEAGILWQIRQPEGEQDPIRPAAKLWRVQPTLADQTIQDEVMTLVSDHLQLTGDDYQRAVAAASNRQEFVRRTQPQIRQFGDLLKAVKDQPTPKRLIQLLDTYASLTQEIPLAAGARGRPWRRPRAPDRSRKFSIIGAWPERDESTELEVETQPAQPHTSEPTGIGQPTLLEDGRVSTPVQLAGAGVTVAGHVVRGAGSVEATVLVLVSGDRFEQLHPEGLPAGVEGTLLVVVGSTESGGGVVVGEGTVVGGADLGALLLAAPTVYRPGQPVRLLVDGGLLGQAVLADLSGALPASASVTQQSLSGWGKSPAAAGPAEPFVQVPLSGAGDQVWLFHRGGVWHLWAGINPSQEVMNGLARQVGAGTVVVHAHGAAEGGLGRFAEGIRVGMAAAKAGQAGAGEAGVGGVRAGGASLAVLLACAQAQAQAFRDEHDIEVGASDAFVFVNELDGSVFVGQGEVDANGKLTAALALPIPFWRYPKGRSQPRVRFDPPPITVLTAEQAMAHRGRWVQRFGVGRWLAALAGVWGSASGAPAGNTERRVGMVVRDWRAGVSELPTHGATDVAVAGFQYRLNTTYPGFQFQGNTTIPSPDPNDYVHGLDPVLLLNGVPVDDSGGDRVLRDVAGLAGVNRFAMLGGSSNDSSGFGDLGGDGYLPASAWDVTFPQLYPPLRHMLRTYSFTGLNLFPNTLYSNAFNYSRLIDAVRADFGQEFMVALTWSGNVGDGYSADWGRQVREVMEKVDWHVLYGEPRGGWAGVLRQVGLDPSRVLVLVDTGEQFTPGPLAETFDSEESISAGIGALGEEVPDLLGVVGWDFANAQPADSPWLWTQYAARALAEGDYVPGERAAQRRGRRIRDGVAAFVSVMLVVTAGGAVWVRFRYAPTRRLPVVDTELGGLTPAGTVAGAVAGGVAGGVAGVGGAVGLGEQPGAGAAGSSGVAGAGVVGAVVVDADLDVMVRLLAGRSGPVTEADWQRLAERVGVADRSGLVGLMRFARTVLGRRPGDLAELDNVGRIRGLVEREVPGEAGRGASVAGLEVLVAGLLDAPYLVRSTPGDWTRIVAGAGQAAGSVPGGAVTLASMAAALGPDFLPERQRRLLDHVTRLANGVLWLPDPAAEPNVQLAAARAAAGMLAGGSGLVLAMYVGGERSRPSWDGQDLWAEDIAGLTARLRRDGTWDGGGRLELWVSSVEWNIAPAQAGLPRPRAGWQIGDDLFLAQVVLARYRGGDEPAERPRVRVVSLHGQTLVWGRVGGLNVLVPVPDGHVVRSVSPTTLVLFREGDSPPAEVARPSDPDDLSRWRLLGWRVDREVALGWLSKLGEPGQNAILDLRLVKPMTAAAALRIARRRGNGSGPVALPLGGLTGQMSHGVARHVVGVDGQGRRTFAMLAVREFHVYADAGEALARVLRERNLPAADLRVRGKGFTAVRNTVPLWRPFDRDYVIDFRSLVVLWVHHRKLARWVVADLGPFGKSDRATLVIGRRGELVPELVVMTVIRWLNPPPDARLVVHGLELVESEKTNLPTGPVGARAQRLPDGVVMVWPVGLDAGVEQARRAAAAGLHPAGDEVVVYVLPEMDDEEFIHAVDQVLTRLPRGTTTVRLVVAGKWAAYDWAARYAAVTVRVERAAGALARAPAVTTAPGTPNWRWTAEQQATYQELHQKLTATLKQERAGRWTRMNEALGGYQARVAPLMDLLVARVEAGAGTQGFYQAVQDSLAAQPAVPGGDQPPSVESIRFGVRSALQADFQAYLDDPDRFKKAPTHPHTDVLRRHQVDVDDEDVREEYLQHTAAVAGVWNPDRAEYMIDVVASVWEWAATLLLEDRARHVGDPARAPKAYLYFKDAKLQAMRQPPDGRVRPAAQLWPVAPVPVGPELLHEVMTFVGDHPQLTGPDYHRAVAAAANPDGFVRRTHPTIRQFGDLLTAVTDQPTLELLSELLITYESLTRRIPPPATPSAVTTSAVTPGGATTSAVTPGGATTSGAMPGPSADATTQGGAGGRPPAPAVTATGSPRLSAPPRAAVRELAQRLVSANLAIRAAQSILVAEVTRGYQAELASLEDLLVPVEAGNQPWGVYPWLLATFPEQVQTRLETRLGGQPPSVALIRDVVLSELQDDFQAYDDDPDPGKDGRDPDDDDPDPPPRVTTHPITDLLRRYGVDVDEAEVREEYRRQAGAAEGGWNPDEAEHIIDVLARSLVSRSRCCCLTGPVTLVTRTPSRWCMCTPRTRSCAGCASPAAGRCARRRSCGRCRRPRWTRNCSTRR